MKKKILFLLNTYGFQSNYINKKKTLERNYFNFNALDNNWPNYFYNNLKNDFVLMKDYPNLNKVYFSGNHYEFLESKIIKFKPDLIFTTVNDPYIDYILRKFRRIKKIIWISYKINEATLYNKSKVYNYLISSNRLVLSLAKKIKFKSFMMNISAPKFCNLQLKDYKKRANEIIFTGSLGSNFSDRLDVLLFLQNKIKLTVRIRNLIERFFLLNSINYYLIKLCPKFANFLYKKKILPLTNKLKFINKEEVFGKKMLNELKKYKFVLNIHSNFDKNKNINARVYEALSCGCLLFNENNVTMKKTFKDKKHVVYFSSKRDLIKKFNFYKNNLNKAYKIAKSGNKLFMQNHQSYFRIRNFKEILNKIIKAKN